MVVEEWAERAKHHKGLPVLITHGVNDSVLPFVASGWYAAILGFIAILIAQSCCAHIFR